MSSSPFSSDEELVSGEVSGSLTVRRLMWSEFSIAFTGTMRRSLITNKFKRI